ncbi:hypothetical protein CASFOL_027521 [Castilleja foliolosa]|uniref:AMP-activated protein kinase glycogen-binding domain-containing protein n=1 Tax=Castilleja foliolosa TaxID=1961234 RepID=A0ABD3CF18_9LAMI
MAMAVICHFPTYFSHSSQKLSFCSSHFPLPIPNINYPHKCRYSTIVASSIKKPTRASRKVRSDADLCNDIREFLSSAGLPENYVPTMKELSQYGRQDLANVVRRRGYKFIKQLLTTPSTENIVRPNIETGQTEILEVLGGSEGQDEKQKVIVGVSSNESIIETDEELISNDQSYVATESNTLLLLQEKVAKFIQHGELDSIEGSGLEITNEIRVDEHGTHIESEDSRGPESEFSHHKQKELMIGGEMSNGSVPSSVQEIEDPGKSYISTKEQTSIDGDEDLNEDAVYSELKVENRAEVTRLKFLLHQKELELTKLKEKIEKEKTALSLLQTKAETEINKAQKLISRKETELHAAEETLSGLKEVEVEYSGDGETVEIAGSFNGWDHKITMDLQPSSSSRLWRAVLWLYPGVYEIKFIIDGHWRVDPLRESISWNGVHNNILRVDR